MLDVPLSVLDVTLLFSCVNGDYEVLCDSDCELVEPQTLSLSRKREAFLAGNQEDMNFSWNTGESSVGIQKKEGLRHPHHTRARSRRLRVCRRKWRCRTRNLTLVKKNMRVSIGARHATERC